MRLADAAKGSLGLDLLAEVTLLDAGGSSSLASRPCITAAPPSASVYSATKAAVDAVTRSLAKELGPRKIRVNAINPGATELILTMLPPWAPKCFTASFAVRISPRTLRSNWRWKCAS